MSEPTSSLPTSTPPTTSRRVLPAMLSRTHRASVPVLQGRARTATRFMKFAVVGLSGTAIHLGLFRLFTAHFGMQYMLSGVLALEAGLLSNYLLNNIWTFSDRRFRFRQLGGLGKYHVVAGGGIVINLLLLRLLTGTFGVDPFLASVAGIPPATAWNFSLNLLWTWQVVPA